MAIYHLHVKNISRSDGRSAVAAAAYRAGETLPNEAEERDSQFGGRRDVVHAELLLPTGAPDWMSDRSKLWNAAERAERRKDARLAKEIEFALPREIPPAEWLSVARAMAATYVARGHVVDLAVHDNGTGHNPHAHLLLTTRLVTGDGFGAKLRDADALAFVTEARKTWAAIANEALAAAGVAAGIDPRSHTERGLSSRPSRHRGPDEAERRARREEGRVMKEKGTGPMNERAQERDGTYPVPDPDSRPISPAEQERAEDAMLREMERQVPAEQQTAADASEWWERDSPHNVGQPQPKDEGVDWWDREDAPERGPSSERQDQSDDRDR